jgi:hypothetical protein
MTVRRADNQGRVVIGRRHAGKEFAVHFVSETEVRLFSIDAIPERERWLYRTPKALSMVLKGLEDAKAGRFCKNPPDLAADAHLAE